MSHGRAAPSQLPQLQLRRGCGIEDRDKKAPLVIERIQQNMPPAKRKPLSTRWRRGGKEQKTTAVATAPRGWVALDNSVVAPASVHAGARKSAPKKRKSKRNMGLGAPRAQPRKTGGDRPSVPSSSHDAVQGRARKKKSRLNSSEIAAATQDLPKDMGAESRRSAFAKEGRSQDAARQALDRSARAILEPVHKHMNKGDYDKAAAALGAAVRHPDIRALLAAAGINLSEDGASLDTLMIDNLKELIAPIVSRGRGKRTVAEEAALKLIGTAFVSDASPQRKSGSKRGRSADAVRSGEGSTDCDSSARAAGNQRAHSAERSSGSSATAGPSSSAPPGIPYRTLSKRLGIAQSTGDRNFEAALQNRRALKKKSKGAYLIDMRKRMGSRRIKAEVIEALAEFIVDHPNVRTSPYPTDTLLVRGANGKKDVRVPRLLLEIGVPRFYQDFVKAHPQFVTQRFCRPTRKSGPHFAVGERKFGMLLPPNVRRMTARRESCGCTDHTRMRGLHSCLNRKRTEMAKKLGARYTPLDHRHGNYL